MHVYFIRPGDPAARGVGGTQGAVSRSFWSTQSWTNLKRDTISRWTVQKAPNPLNTLEFLLLKPPSTLQIAALTSVDGSSGALHFG